LTLPYFFVEDLNTKKIILDEDTSKHISVLRMQKGEQILLTDGKGKKAQANIIDDNRKKCMIEIFSVQNEEERKRSVAIGISLLKNTSRFEWFLEKATEIGVSEIIPLLCERTEKEKFRFDRMQQILISAMLQSQQCWLPVLHYHTNFTEFIQSNLYHRNLLPIACPKKKFNFRKYVHHSLLTFHNPHPLFSSARKVILHKWKLNRLNFKIFKLYH